METWFVVWCRGWCGVWFEAVESELSFVTAGE
jgi:hypothetical protein